MIIKVKPKRTPPEANAKRLKRKFFLYKRDADRIFICEWLYLKQRLRHNRVRDYEYARSLYLEGKPYKKGDLKIHNSKLFSDGHNIRNLWETHMIMTKKEAFVEVI